MFSVAKLYVRLHKKLLTNAFKYDLNSYPNISSKAKLHYSCQLIGPKENFNIGKDTYINNAQISCGVESDIYIGTGCAIGNRVSIKAITHDKRKPTNNNKGKLQHIEKTIVIGDNCWIGDGVFIREGVVIGDGVIIGANSVVTKNFPSGSVIVGIPARKM